MKTLKYKKVAIAATNGFEQSELFEPKKALEDAGAEVEIISIESGKIKAWHNDDWGKKIDVDFTFKEASFDEYDALVLPGGVMNPDQLRIDPDAIKFIKSFVKARKPIGAICHGSWTLIEADAVQGKTMTSWPSLQTDLKNAGAHWIDQMVIVDGNLVTSRKPADLPAFNARLIEMIERGTSAPLFRKAEQFNQFNRH